MKIAEFFPIQENLDKRIIEDHDLQEVDLIKERILALLVENGECANETRCFKYWSKKPPAKREVILEEYVDGFHLVLSIGLDLKEHGIISRLPESYTPIVSSGKRTDQFIQVYRSVIYLADSLDSKYGISPAAAYKKLFEDFLGLGILLGFAPEQIKEAYLKKNLENHERQTKGY